MAKNTVYYPSRTFDDSLAAFVDLMTANGWSFPNASAEELRADLEAQRGERSSLDLAKANWSKLEAEFLLNQQERFKRFSSVLHAARGAFRDDPAVMAQLEQFKRKSQTRTRPTASSAATEEA
jgi:hypothetical protein